MPRTCLGCGAEAANARLLLNHQQKHQLTASVTLHGQQTRVHRDSEEEDWFCPAQGCVTSLGSLGSLRNHLRRFHLAAQRPESASPSVSGCSDVALARYHLNHDFVPCRTHQRASIMKLQLNKTLLQCSSSRETRDAGEARRRAARTTLPCRQLADAGKTPLHLTKTLTLMQKAAPTTARSTNEKTGAAQRAQTHTSPLQLDLQQPAFIIFNPCT